MNRIFNRVLKNVSHKRVTENNKKKDMGRARARAASQIQGMWNTKRLHERKRGRWTEMYIKRKNEKTRDVERRKEQWTEKMMRRSRYETLSLRMHNQSEKTKNVVKGQEPLHDR